MKQLGKRIRSKREELGLTAEDLGRKLGVTKSTISKWERAEVEHIKRSYINEMSEIFNCSPEWLMGFDGAPEVKVTYNAEGQEPVTAVIDHQPIIGGESERSQRALLYKVALEVKPENIQTAIKILKALI